MLMLARAGGFSEPSQRRTIYFTSVMYMISLHNSTYRCLIPLRPDCVTKQSRCPSLLPLQHNHRLEARVVPILAPSAASKRTTQRCPSFSRRHPRRAYKLGRQAWNWASDAQTDSPSAHRVDGPYVTATNGDLCATGPDVSRSWSPSPGAPAETLRSSSSQREETCRRGHSASGAAQNDDALERRQQTAGENDAGRWGLLIRRLGSVEVSMSYILLDQSAARARCR